MLCGCYKHSCCTEDKGTRIFAEGANIPFVMLEEMVVGREGFQRHQGPAQSREGPELVSSQCQVQAQILQTCQVPADYLQATVKTACPRQGISAQALNSQSHVLRMFTEA